MKKETLTKIGLFVFTVWETYYTYWCFKVHHDLMSIGKK
jgi:hypothetical protein